MRLRKPLAASVLSVSALLTSSISPATLVAAGSALLLPNAVGSAHIVELGSARYDFEEALSHLHVPSALLPRVPHASHASAARTTTSSAAHVHHVSAPTPAAATSPRQAGGGSATQAVPALGTAAYRDYILSMINFDWRSLDFSIDFTGPRSGYLGLTTVGFPSAPHNHVEIYVRPGESIAQVTYIAAYEIGHVVDITRNNDTDRKSWLKLRGNPGASWFACNACTEDMVGAGDFSDVFAWATTNHGYYVSAVAAPPSSSQLAALKPFFGS